MGKLLSLIIIIALIYFFIVPKFRTKKTDQSTELEACDECGTFYEKSTLSVQNSRKICASCLEKLKEQK